MNSSPYLRPRLFRLFVAVTGLSLPIIATSSTAVSANTYGVSYFISPPLVQNSYVTNGAILENFDTGMSGASCETNRPIGTITGTCSYSNGFQYGGATSETSNPIFGGTSSIYATGGGGSPSMTFALKGPQRYLGFWWSAGSASNTVKFFSGSDEVLSLTTADLMTLLGTAPSSFGSTGSITAVDGSTHVKHRYFGHPRGHAKTAPTANSSVTPNEPFTYLHVFTSGGLTFDKVQLSGGGFEFDNFVVSNVAQTPPTNLIRVGSITGTLPSTAKVVTFHSNGGTGSMDNQVASLNQALSLNTFSKLGHTFLGWSTSQTGAVNEYDNQAPYDFTADTTLYARWSAISYSVTYDEQGGSDVSDSAYTTGATISLPVAPTKSGNAFNGWFKSLTGGTALGTTYTPSGAQNITLYAQWTQTPSASPTTTSTSPSTTALVPPTPSLVAPRTALAGEPISIVARGFKPGERVVLRIGDGKTTTLIADQNGEIRLDVVLDSKVTGSKKVVASAVGGRSVSSEIQVSAPIDLPKTGSTTSTGIIFGSSILLFGFVLILWRRRTAFS
jgi:uncharacterized repeat protein (TIGR02543 family)/LPXTG-motif cell wall-anchored protein